MDVVLTRKLYAFHSVFDGGYSLQEAYILIAVRTRKVRLPNIPLGLIT